jgi:hypothetical protein
MGSITREAFGEARGYSREVKDGKILTAIAALCSLVGGEWV